MKSVLLSLIFAMSLHAHGIFYSINKAPAIIISASFSELVPAQFGKILIYKGDSAIPLISSKLDAKGNFAFLPPEKGEYKVIIKAGSDHGEHKVEFDLKVDENLQMDYYQKPNFEKYFAILSSMALILGLFAFLYFLKSRKKSSNL